jgi:hypothetical protein
MFYYNIDDVYPSGVPKLEKLKNVMYKHYPPTAMRNNLISCLFFVLAFLF